MRAYYYHSVKHPKPLDKKTRLFLRFGGLYLMLISFNFLDFTNLKWLNILITSTSFILGFLQLFFLNSLPRFFTDLSVVPPKFVKIDNDKIEWKLDGNKVYSINLHQIKKLEFLNNDLAKITTSSQEEFLIPLYLIYNPIKAEELRKIFKSYKPKVPVNIL